MKGSKKKAQTPRVFTPKQIARRRFTSLRWYHYNMDNTPGFPGAQREKAAVSLQLHFYAKISEMTPTQKQLHTQK